MRLSSPVPAAWAARLRSVVRSVAAFLFVAHGPQKLFGFPAAGPSSPVPLISLLGLAGTLETGGGTLLLLGLFTRPVAFLLAGEMAVAYFLRHAPHGFWPLVNRGELPGLFFLLYLYLAAAGGGPPGLPALPGGGRAAPRASAHEGQARQPAGARS